jgi:hypothetical protein
MKIILTFSLLFIFSAHGHSQGNYNAISMYSAKHSVRETPKKLNLQEAIITTRNGNADGFDFSIIYLPYYTLGGYGKKLGSEIQVFEVSTWLSEGELPTDVFDDYRSDYGDISNPIITGPTPNNSFMINAGYTLNNTRLGVSWHSWSAGDLQSGEVPGFNLTDEANRSEFGYGFVSFWEMGWDLHASRNFPASWYEGFRDVENNNGQQYDLTFYPDRGSTRWRVSHESRLNSFEFSVQHPVIRNENLDLILTGGVQHGRWRDDLLQTLDITFHRDLTDRWMQNIWNPEAMDSILVEVNLTSVVHNDITLETNSSVRYNPVGVLIGAEADWRVLPSLSLSVKASTSRMLGDVSMFANGTDVDDIVETSSLVLFDETGGLIYADALTGYEFLSGVFNLPQASWQASAVNYRMSIAARYEFTNNLSIIGGYYFTMWKDLPMAPQWSYSDQFTNPYGAFAVENSWNTNIRSGISGSGFMAGIGLRF